MAEGFLSSCILIAFSIALLVLFLGVVIVSGIGFALAKTMTLPFVALMIIGVAGLVISVFGIIGARYDTHNRPRRLFCLIIFYIFSILFTVLFVVLSGTCFTFRNAVDILELSPGYDTTELLRKFDIKGEDFSKLIDGLKQAKGIFLAAGVVTAVIAAVGFITVVAGSCKLGRKNYQTFFTITGSLLLLLLGIVLIIGGAMSSKLTNLVDKTTLNAAAVVLIVAGSIMILISLLGFVHTCCLKGAHRIILTIYTIGVIAVGAICVAAFILLVYAYSHSDFKADQCPKDEKDDRWDCDHFVKALQQYRCDKIENETERTTCKNAINATDVMRIISDALKSVIALGIVVICILITIIVFILIAAFSTCCSPDSSSDSLSRDMPDYRKQDNIAY